MERVPLTNNIKGQMTKPLGQEVFHCRIMGLCIRMIDFSLSRRLIEIMWPICQIILSYLIYINLNKICS